MLPPHDSQFHLPIQNTSADYTGQEFVEALFRLVPPSSSSGGFLRYCVDVGARNGEEYGDSVTHALLVRGEKDSSNDERDEEGEHHDEEWLGILIQPDSRLYRSLQRIHQPLGNRLLQVTPSAKEGLNERNLVWILRQYTPELPYDFDFLCLSGMGWSYWIMRDFLESRTFQPKLVCVPFDPTHDNIVAHVPLRQDKDGLANILALVDLMSDHQYQLVMTTKWCAFFVPGTLYETYLRTRITHDIRHKSSPTVNHLLPTPAVAGTANGDLGRVGYRILNKVPIIKLDEGETTQISPKTQRNDSLYAWAPQSHSNTMKAVWMSQRKNHIKAGHNTAPPNTTRNNNTILGMNFKNQLTSSWAKHRASIQNQSEGAEEHPQQQKKQQHRQRQMLPSKSGKLTFQRDGSGIMSSMKKTRELREIFSPILRRKSEDPPEIRDEVEVPISKPTNCTPTIDQRHTTASSPAKKNKSARRVQLKLPGSDDPPAPTISERHLDASGAPEPAKGVLNANAHHNVSMENLEKNEHRRHKEVGSVGPISSDGDGERLEEEKKLTDWLQLVELHRDQAHFGSLEDYETFLHKLVFINDESDSSVVAGMDYSPDCDHPDRVTGKGDENDDEEEIVFTCESPRKTADTEVPRSAHERATSKEIGDISHESKPIDLRSFCIQSHQSNTAERQACASELVSTLKEKGYALVHGSGISRFLCQDALSASRLLLDESEESVRRCCISEHNSSRGYSPLCSEQSGDINLLDMVRKFRVGSSEFGDQPNIWPHHDNMDEETTEYIRASLQNYHDNVRIVAIAIIECLCNGLALKTNHDLSEPSHGKLLQSVRGIDSSILTVINCGRGSRHIANKPLVAPHRDQNVISLAILDGGDCATFQYESEDGEWKSLVPPRVIPDDPILLVYSGQSLRTWSNDYFPSKFGRILPGDGSQTVNGLIFSLKKGDNVVKLSSQEIDHRSNESEESSSAISNMASQLREISATFESMIMADFTESSFGASQLSSGDESEVTSEEASESRSPGVQAALTLSSRARFPSFASSMFFDDVTERDEAPNRLKKSQFSLDSMRPDSQNAPSTKETTSTVVGAARASRCEKTSTAGSYRIDVTNSSGPRPNRAERKRENPFRVAREKLLAKYSHGPRSSTTATGKDEMQQFLEISSPQRFRSESLSRLLPPRFKRPVSSANENFMRPPSSWNHTNVDGGAGKMSKKQKIQERIEQLKRQRALERQSRNEKNLKNLFETVWETDQEVHTVGEVNVSASQFNRNEMISFSRNEDQFEPSNKLLEVPGSPRRPIAVDSQDPPGSPTRPIKVDDGFPVVAYLGCTSSSFHRDLSSEQHLLPVAPSWNPPERRRVADKEIIVIENAVEEVDHLGANVDGLLPPYRQRVSTNNEGRKSYARSSMQSSVVEHLSVPDLPNIRHTDSDTHPYPASVGIPNVENQVEYVVSWDDSKHQREYVVSWDDSQQEIQATFFPADNHDQSLPTIAGNEKQSRHPSSDEVSTQLFCFDSRDASDVLSHLLKGSSTGHSPVWMSEETHGEQNNSSVDAKEHRPIEPTDNNDEPIVAYDGMTFESSDGAEADGHHPSNTQPDLHDEQTDGALDIKTKRLRGNVPSSPSDDPIIQEQPLSSRSRPAMSMKAEEDEDEGHKTVHDLTSQVDRLGVLGALQREAVSSFLYGETLTFPQHTEDETDSLHHQNKNTNNTSPPSPGLERRGSPKRKARRDEASLPPAEESELQGDPPRYSNDDHQPEGQSDGIGTKDRYYQPEPHQSQQEVPIKQAGVRRNSTSYVMGQVRQWRNERKMLREVQLSKWAQKRITSTPDNDNGGTGGEDGGDGGSNSSVSDVTDDYNKGCAACGASSWVEDAVKAGIPLQGIKVISSLSSVARGNGHERIFLRG